MLIQNNYLNKCIQENIKFSMNDFKKSLTSNYSLSFSPEVNVDGIFYALMAENFKEDFTKLKNKNLANVYKLATLKNIDFYDQILYILAVLIPFKELFVLKMLGQDDKDSLEEKYPHFNTQSQVTIEELNNIITRLTELGVYSE